MAGERGLTVALVGATGLVGREIGNVLHERRFRVGTLRLLGSIRTAGTALDEEGWQGKVAPLTVGSFEGVDLAFFAGGPGLAGEFAPQAVQAGAMVIDCSSRFRFSADIPLVVPEVNAEAVAERREHGIIAIPSATAIALSVALAPLAVEAGLRRVIVSTYQGVASAGRRAVHAFSKETIDLLGGRGPRRTQFVRPLAFNCLPQIGALATGGDTVHEVQTVYETRRVLGLPELPMLVTAVRVPAFFGTGISVAVETDGPLAATAAADLLRAAPGVLVHDEVAGPFPTPAEVTGSDATHVGRIRDDTSVGHGLALWIALDSVRKGAALTAVQVGEIVAREYL